MTAEELDAMLYLANPCTAAIRARMAAGDLGVFDTPHQGNVLPAGVPWAADNGCFSERWELAHWTAWLEGHRADVPRCLFAVVPDVVSDRDATRARWDAHHRTVLELGYPAAYALQNGETPAGVPWADLSAVFVGGDTAWKLGPDARRIVATARDRGVWVHVGRVNSLRRLRYAVGIGADSADGTFLTRAPDTNLERLIRYLRHAHHPALWGPDTWSAP